MTNPSHAYADLGPYSDLVGAVRAQWPLFPTEPLTRETAKKVLRFTIGDEHPRDLQRIRAWQSDGVSGEEFLWSVGYGPRTHAFLRGNYHAEFFNGPHRFDLEMREKAFGWLKDMLGH